MLQLWKNCSKLLLPDWALLIKQASDKCVKAFVGCLLFVWLVWGLPHLLLADGGYEFLEVEWFEVGYVLEVGGAVGCEGWS